MDRTRELLAEWMPGQRWFAAKGRRTELSIQAWWDLPLAEDDEGVARTYLVVDTGATPAITYQVPTVLRPAGDTPATAAIGSPEPGTVLVDGPHDPGYAAALLRLLTAGGRVAGTGIGVAGAPATAAPALGSAYTSAVLSGEQSNTSIVYRPGSDGIPVIAKVFRQVHAGLNPDVELTSALGAAGSPFVARAIGAVEGSWTDAATHEPAHGSLAFAQEFLPGVEDAWRVALRAGASGEDFTEPAHALGAATARVHAGLAELFPTRPVTETGRAQLIEGWRGRLAAAAAEVPQLAGHVTAIEAVYSRAASGSWPALQRVHGDYHLGQVILVPGRGWVLLDFEGEPLRPMAERLEPDLALRDVAGMLRSFDYVAGSLQLDAPHGAADGPLAWARTSRAAFLAGYEDTAGIPVAGALLDALELDKAVYETLYEARNRPAWLPIPLGAITRLAQS